MGRPKGSKNIRSFNAEEIAKRMDVCPLEFLLTIVKGDWKALGFDGPTKISYTGAGIEFEELNVPLCERNKAAAKACNYLFAAKQSVALSTGSEGIKIEVVDYCTLAKVIK
jgi:hypothetical protein